MKKTALRKKGFNVNTYGYNFSKADFSITLLAFVLGTWLICYLHHLEASYTIVVMLTMVLLLPFMISSYFRYKHEKQHFEEYCTYFEYAKIYYKSRKKIKLMLENIVDLFDKKSNMRKCIEKAIDEINLTGDYAKALSYIDKDYHTSHLERFHNLLITGEEHGADSVYDNLDLIMFDDWKEDIQAFQNRKKIFRYIMYGMVLFGIGLSIYGANIFFNDMAETIDGAKLQLYTFVDIECMLVFFVYLYMSLVNKKWVRSDE